MWQSWSGPENGDNITHCVRPNVLKHSDNFISNWKKGHIYIFFIFVNNMTFIFSDICLQCTSQRGCTFVHSPSQHRCKQSCHGKPRQGSYHLKTQGRQSSQQLAFYWWIWLNTPVVFEYFIVEISHVNTVFFKKFLSEEHGLPIMFWDVIVVCVCRGTTTAMSDQVLWHPAECLSVVLPGEYLTLEIISLPSVCIETRSRVSVSSTNHLQ